MGSKLRIYSDRKWLPQGSNYIIMLYPFWGDITLPSSDPDAGRFDEYIDKGKNLLELTDKIEDCDYTVLPFEYSFEKEKKEIAEKAARESGAKNKKMIVFFNSDSIDKIELENAIVFRTSFFKSSQRHNEMAFPGWSVDFMKKYPPSEIILKKKNIPEISYCGYVDALQEQKRSLAGKVKSLLIKMKKGNPEYGSRIRGRAVRTLLTDKRIRCNFIIRDGFWAQGIEDKHKVRKEYAENMFASPYALVTRGAGNFSYRLLEVMSCGRIPVFIDTDCVLPMENKIDWKKQTVWIDEKHIDKIGDLILDFHNTISESGFTGLQKENRKIYEDYLSPVGFFGNLKTLL